MRTANKWVVIRLMIIAMGVSCSKSLLDALATSTPPIGWVFILLVAMVAPATVLLLVWLQSINPMSPRTWHVPRWTTNPFLLFEPLHQFHLGSYFFIGAGVAALVIWLVTRSGTLPGACAMLAVGLATLLGVKLSEIYFSDRFSESVQVERDGN